MAEINIAKQLLAARHEKKITQEELASYVGVCFLSWLLILTCLLMS